MRLAPFVPVAVLVVLSGPLAAPARAAPWFDARQDDLEDRFVDGDLDEEDVVALRSDRASGGSSDVHGQTWVSVLGFDRSLLSGRNDVGGIVVVGLALDRIAAGSVHRLADPASSSKTSYESTPAPAAGSDPPLAAPMLARECVAAALRTSGLGEDDARIDALVARARASALLPETRLRAMRLWDDAAHATTLATTDDTSYYDAIGANLVLELRLTWRLDRWLYAGDEPTLERVRLERQEARTHVATRALEALFAWQRAAVEGAEAAAGSSERLEARLRAAEAEATLDVLTGGWFSRRDER
jgi:hypothetical protein